MTHRDGAEAEGSPFLREIRERWPERAESRDVAVGPLEMEDARRLALTLLESDDERSLRTAHAVARESRGSPFLIEELTRSNRGDASPAGSTLSVLDARSAGRPEARSANAGGAPAHGDHRRRRAAHAALRGRRGSRGPGQDQRARGVRLLPALRARRAARRARSRRARPRPHPRDDRRAIRFTAFFKRLNARAASMQPLAFLAVSSC
jgi:hypothetical protein